MTHLLCLGAINKVTLEYVYPKIANKQDKYVCPECNKDLILCQGKLRVHHFRHKVDNLNPCHYYSNPTESQIHKDAKTLLKKLLDNNMSISIVRNCCNCKKQEEFEIPNISDTSNIQVEYRFEYNGHKTADVAYIDSGNILCIFEICNTHKTSSEHRPEPWFEIDATTLIDMANDNSLTTLQIPCIRSEKCDDCVNNENYKIAKKNEAIDKLYNWFNSGIEIPPFKFNNDFKYECCKKYVNCNETNELFDIIVYEKSDGDTDDNIRERYCIRLLYKTQQYVLTNKIKYASSYIGVYYLNIDWILKQRDIPKIIDYNALLTILDCYDEQNIDRYCRNCKSDWPFWVEHKNIDSSNYKILHIGCTGCGDNAGNDTVRCNVCNKLCELNLMKTNKISINICKTCDVDLFANNVIYGIIYLNVPYCKKDDIKLLGGTWDSCYKKWYIHNNNPNKNSILLKYELANWNTH